MTMHKLYRALLIAACSVLALSSCVKDEENLFDKSAPVRVSEALANAQKVLTGAENGWAVYYYPDGSQTYGGFIFTMKFTDEEVTVGSELFEDEYTSLYSMTRDNGPVLSFDTNNYAFHYLATPSGSQKNLYGESGLYQAYHGDFEFMILSASAEEVVLRGKRTGNHIHLYPLQETPASYMQKVNNMVTNLFVSSFDGTINGENMHIYLSLGDRQASFTLSDDKYKDEEGNDLTKTAAYLYTENGISLYKPLDIGPYTFKEISFDIDTKKLSAEGYEMNMQGKLPEGWHAYDDFLGKYTLVYNNGKSTIPDVEIVEDVHGSSFLIKGLSQKFDAKATYDLGLGRLHLQAQYVATEKETDNGYMVMMACWDASAGKVQYTTGGLYGVLNEDASKVEWVDNKQFSGYTVSGFILYFFTTAGSRVGSASAPWLWTGRETLTSGAHQSAYWVSLDRQ